MASGDERDTDSLGSNEAMLQTSKALTTLCNNIDQALTQADSRDKQLEKIADVAIEREMEAKKSLETHVSRIHQLVDHYHRQQVDALRQNLKEFLNTVMMFKIQESNYTARLTDLRKQVEEKIDVIWEENDVTERDKHHVTAFLQQFSGWRAPSLTSEITDNITFSLEVPGVMADAIQTLVGHFVTSSNGVTAGHSFRGSHFSERSVNSAPKSSSSELSGCSGRSASSPSQQILSEFKVMKDDMQSSTSAKVGANASSPSHKITKENFEWKNFISPEMATGPVTNSAAVFPHTIQSLNSIDSIGPVTSTTLVTNSPSGARNGTAQLLTPTVSPKRSRKIFIGRGKVVSGMAARADGKVWLVYCDKDPHLDLMDENGNIVQSTRIGKNAAHVDAYGADDVLVASHSPRMVTLYEDGIDPSDDYMEILDYKCTGLAVSRSGMAVSGEDTIYWFSENGNNDQWIVPQENSDLQYVSALAAVEAEGKEVICAADEEGQVVYFYRKSLRKRFFGMDSFCPPEDTLKKKKKQVFCFSPVSLSAHPAGFLGVLDSASHSVYVLKVGKEQVVSVATIPGHHLCNHVPLLISFAQPDPDVSAQSSMWVATSAGHVCLARLSVQLA